ncbi:MAG: hypothetical protein ACI9WU_001701 [Myxococcota bacterium]|jgi:hypothetical protein
MIRRITRLATSLVLAAGLTMVVPGCVVGPDESQWVDDPTAEGYEAEPTETPGSANTLDENNPYEAPGPDEATHNKADESGETGPEQPTVPEPVGEETGTESSTVGGEGGSKGGVSHGSPQPLDPHNPPAEEAKESGSETDDDE